MEIPFACWLRASLERQRMSWYCGRTEMCIPSSKLKIFVTVSSLALLSTDGNVEAFMQATASSSSVQRV